MEWVETTGRTIEEAKEAALDQLGVDESDAEFVVVVEPRPGLFGRLRGEARVRARVMPTSPRPKRGRTRRPASDRRGAGQRPSSSSRSGGSAVAVAEAEGTDLGAEAAGAPANGSRSSAGARTGSSSGSRNRRRSRGRGGARTEAGKRAADTGTQASPGETPSSTGSAGSRRGETAMEEEQTGMGLTLEEQGEAAREFVTGLLHEMGIVADVSVRTVDESTAEVAVNGSELGFLIGPGGATLGALQELTRTVVQRRTGGHSDRILVDVAGYRLRRAEALQRFTRQVAEEVLASGTERALEPMSAADRKVVHDTVNDIAGVETRSQGEDPHRHIVILPASTSTTGSADD